ncbi:MAG: hypothetical protein NTZ35_01075 [Ignavibacteriales bacterium]|nr:hypothetical protein [Ignavibacteriales bacterium]
MLSILRLNCISCGHSVNLHEDVYADYEGLIKCDACGELLNIKIQEGKLRSMAPGLVTGISAAKALSAGATAHLPGN